MALAADPQFTCANLFGGTTSLQRRLLGHAAARLHCRWPQAPGHLNSTRELRARLQLQLGQFPLFDFWGPRTSIKSSQWIADSAVEFERNYRPTRSLVYLTHLDYNLQSSRPCQPYDFHGLKRNRPDLGKADRILRSERHPRCHPFRIRHHRRFARGSSQPGPAVRRPARRPRGAGGSLGSLAFGAFRCIDERIAGNQRPSSNTATA